MADEEVVLGVIYNALETLNAELAVEEQISVGPDTVLFGEASSLDSLSLVSVIVDIETGVSDKFGQPVSLSDDRAMSRNPAPFTSVETLKAYILEVLA